MLKCCGSNKNKSYACYLFANKDIDQQNGKELIDSSSKFVLD